MEKILETLKNLTKQQKIIAGIIVAVVVIALVVGGILLSGNSQRGTENSEAGEKTYTVEVKTEGGKGFKELEVRIYEDDTLTDLAAVGVTDENGVYSFVAEASDKYAVVLNNVPAGYSVDKSYAFSGESLSLVLKATLLSADQVTSTLGLGDVAVDMTVTTADKESYTISELLKSKKAVVLNFWFEGCQPCKAEFPYMQEAYQQYSDKLEILAVNTNDGDDASVAAYKTNMALSFPMAKADEKYASIYGVMAYPTTVVIDRYGTIAFMHTGSVTSADSFLALFEYFTSDTYVQSTVKNLDDLVVKVEGGDGSLENPYEEYRTDFEVALEGTKEVYYQMFKVDGMLLEIVDPDAYVIFGSEKYEAVDGKVSLILKTEDTYTPAVFAIGNSSADKKNFTVKLSFVEGTAGNPYTMNLGDFNAFVEAGNAQGVYYTYTATENGTLTLKCTSVTDGVNYEFVLYNLNSYVLRNLSSDAEGDGMVSIAANVGDVIQFSVASLPNDENEYPAADFTFNASYEKGEGTGVNPNATVEYKITVTDQKGKAVSGVTVKLNTDIILTTDESGVAKTTLPNGNYIATITAPDGYKSDTTEYIMTKTNNELDITLEKTTIVTKTYTVKVVDESGKAISGAGVTVDGTYVKTDSNGKATFTLEEDTYSASVVAGGYETASQKFSNGTTELTITLKKEATTTKTVTYTVSVVTYKDKAVKNVNVQFKNADVVVTEVTADENGKATADLKEGNYTAIVVDDEYGSGEVTLTASNKSANLVAAKKASDKETFGDIDAVVIKLGASHVKINASQDNYFIYTPNKSGKYKIRTIDTNAKIAFCGSSEHAILTPVYDTNEYVMNVLDDQIGNVVFLISVTNISDGVIVVERTGSADQGTQYTEYVGSVEPSTFTLTGVSGSRKWVDISASSFDIVYNETDGYYHKGSKTGPIIYVTLGEQAQYLSMEDLIANTGLKNSNKAEDYTPLMAKYVSCMDASYGVYPLTEDLKYIFQSAGEKYGWWDKDTTTGNYIFGNADVNTALAWMFECCYWE